MFLSKWEASWGIEKHKQTSKNNRNIIWGTVILSISLKLYLSEANLNSYVLQSEDAMQ